MNNNKISAQLQNDIMRVLRGETTQKIELPTAIMEAAKQASVDLNHAFLDEGYLSAERRREILRRNLNEGLKKCGCSPTSDMVVRFEEEALKPAAEKTDGITEEMVTESAEQLDEAAAKTVKIGKATVKVYPDGRQFFNYPGMAASKRVPLMSFIAKAYGIPGNQVMTSPEAMKGFKLVAANLDDFNAWLKKNNMYSAFTGGMGYDGENLGWWLKNVKKKNIKGNWKKPGGIKEEVEITETESPITEELRNFVANLTEEDRNTLRGLLEAQD